METVRIITGALQTNSYLIVGENKKAVLIDPGDDAPLILSIVKSKGLDIAAILLTHAHFDHCNAVAEIFEKTKAEVYLHGADMLLTETDYNLAAAFGVEFNSFTPTKIIQDNDIFNIAGITVSVLHTPGHTSGSVCYLVDGIIFSGDTLFRLSRGRTDFPTSSTTDIIKSIQRLYALDGEYTVLPGHGEQTLLSYERRYNRV